MNKNSHIELPDGTIVPTIPEEGALDCLDIYVRVENSYRAALIGAGMENAPLADLAHLGYNNHGEKIVGQFDALNYVILIDWHYAATASDADLMGTIAHELAHATAGSKYAHGPRFQAAENRIVEYLRQAGLAINQRQLSGGVIPASDWRSWLGLIFWTIPCFIAAVLWVFFIVGSATGAFVDLLS